MYARTRGWTLGELSVDVVYDNRSTPRRCDVTINLPDGLSPEQVRRLMRAAETCPVRRSIEAWSSTSTCRVSATPPEQPGRRVTKRSVVRSRRDQRFAPMRAGRRRARIGTTPSRPTTVIHD
jgi:hypothetical protein